MAFSNTIGLALCGGSSLRMGTDKSLLQYYDKPQRYHVYDLLAALCDDAFIACNQQQSATIEAGYKFIEDDIAFGKSGPMTALLTAFTQYPKKNILLIGCDYPFLTATELQLFSASCNDNSAAFYNEPEDMYEPVLAWYPYAYFGTLKQMHKTNQFSLQHFLQQNLAVKYLPSDKKIIKSIDTNDGFIQATKLLNGS